MHPEMQSENQLTTVVMLTVVVHEYCLLFGFKICMGWTILLLLFF